MSKVSIKVGPKTYTFNTAEGEEAKIAVLGQLIDSKYQMLGHSRSVQETDNLVFAALFLADELEEVRAESARLRGEVEAAAAQPAAIGDSEDLRAELDAMRIAAERSREENQALRAEIAALREAAHQPNDLFGQEQADDALAEQLEALAARAEQIAGALEATGLEGEEPAD